MAQGSETKEASGSVHNARPPEPPQPPRQTSRARHQYHSTHLGRAKRCSVSSTRRTGSLLRPMRVVSLPSLQVPGQREGTSGFEGEGAQSCPNL